MTVPKGWLVLRTYRRVSGEIFWVTLGQGTAAVGALVGVRLITGALPPAAYGELALGVTIGTLTQQVALAPLTAAALRFFAPAQESAVLKSYLAGVRALLVQATLIILAAVSVLAVGLLALGHVRLLGFLMVATLFALLSGYGASLDSMQNAARQRRVVAWHDASSVWLRYIAAVLLVRAVAPSSGIAMLGFAIGTAVVLASQAGFFWRRIVALSKGEDTPGADDIRRWQVQMRAYAWPFATWGAVTWAQLASDRWALQLFWGSTDVGLYTAAYQIGYYPILLLSVASVQLYAPVLFGQAGDASDAGRMAHARHTTRTMVRVTSILTVLGGAIAFVFHRALFSVLVDQEYQRVSYLLPILVLAGGFFAAGQVAVLFRMAGLETRRLIAPKVATALAGVVLNVAGARWMGMAGVAYANLAFSLLYLLWVQRLEPVVPVATGQSGRER